MILFHLNFLFFFGFKINLFLGSVNFFTANATFVRFEENFDGEELISKTAMMELPTLEDTKRAVNDLKGKKLNGQLVYPSRCQPSK